MTTMQNIEKELNTYSSDQPNDKDLLPPFITKFFTIRTRLVFSETKCVYIVSDIIFNKKYILKQVSGQHLSRSEKEWELLSSLNHPSIPKVYKRYSDDSYTYMIREYFDGMTLDAYVLENGVVQEDEAVALAIQICDLLTYLHSQNPPIIYRDIKPQNLVLRPGGKIGLIDFETSGQYDLQAGSDAIYVEALQTAAPEQSEYQQTEIYALGMLLIYLETGSYDRINACHMTPRLKKIAEKCMEFSPKDRYKNVEEVKKYLLDKRKFVFSRKLTVGLSALLIGSTIVFGVLSALDPARQAESPKDEEITPAELANNETTTLIKPTKHEEAAQVESTKDEGIPQVESAKDEGIPQAESTKDATATQAEPTKREETAQAEQGNDATTIPVEPTNRKETENVTFKNPGIEKAVRSVLGKTADEPLGKSELDRVTSIEIIGDLQTPVAYGDLQHDYYGNRLAYNGKDLKRGPVDSLEDLALLPCLSELTLVYQQITDLSGIEKLHYLYFVSLAYNNISDLTPLKDMESITFLRINCNPIKDLSPLKNLTKLTYLQIPGTKVDDLSPLSSMQFLTTLDIFQMKDLDLSPLKDLKNLNDIIQ